MSKYTIYSKDGCTHCANAKNLLRSRGLEFEELKIPNQVSKDQLQVRITEAGSNEIVRSVPQIFEGNVYIGGYKQLVSHLS